MRKLVISSLLLTLLLFCKVNTVAQALGFVCDLPSPVVSANSCADVPTDDRPGVYSPFNVVVQNGAASYVAKAPLLPFMLIGDTLSTDLYLYANGHLSSGVSGYTFDQFLEWRSMYSCYAMVEQNFWSGGGGYNSNCPGNPDAGSFVQVFNFSTSGHFIGYFWVVPGPTEPPPGVPSLNPRVAPTPENELVLYGCVFEQHSTETDWLNVRTATAGTPAVCWTAKNADGIGWSIWLLYLDTTACPGWGYAQVWRDGKAYQKSNAWVNPDNHLWQVPGNTCPNRHTPETVESYRPR